jgi:broad specificity phosphatase PhoE
MKIFFVRHGESVLNVTYSHQTPTTRLSERGEKQAEIVAKRLSSMKPDAILCSDCTRAKQTARVIAKKLRKRVEYLPLLDETKGCSELFGLKWNHDKAVAYRTARSKHLEDPEWHYSDEENYHDIRERAKKIAKYLSRRKEKELIVVTHGFILVMVVLSAIFGGNKMRMNDLFNISHAMELDNTGITECEIDDKGEWKLITWNDHSHVK